MVEFNATKPSRRVKITYVIGSLLTGGAEGQLLELLRNLDTSRWDTSLVIFNRQNSYDLPDLAKRVLSLGISGKGNSRFYVRVFRGIKAARELTKHLRRIRPDILHAFLPTSFVLAAPAAKLAGVPLLIGSRRSLVGCYRKGDLLAMADRAATRACDYVLGNSLAVAEELIRVDGIPPERTATIYNGVDTEKFRPGDHGLRQFYGWSDQDVVFGIVANFIPYKRHLDFVHAAALIAQKAPQAKFVMAGEDRGMLPLVREKIARAGLEQRFVIIPGTREPEKLYPAMDAYICTSETEGFSNVLLEAAACGLPLIATRVGGNPEIVSPWENGFLVPVARPEEVAQAALTAAADPIVRRRMGRRSRKLVEQRFSLETMVRQHELLYERALAMRRYCLLRARAQN